MALRDTLRRYLTRDWPQPVVAQRSVWSIDQYASMLSLYDLQYGLRQTLNGKTEEVDNSFAGLVHGAYVRNGIVFACMLARMSLFSQARFMYQQERNGRPGDLFSTPELDILRRPWRGATTGDLLGRAILDVDLAGNFFGVRRPGRIKRLRPDWVDIIIGSETDDDIEAGDIDAEVLGYVYYPGGRYSDRDPVPLLPEQVCHFAPIPDPLASYRGISWLTPIVREIQGDTAATAHKLEFFNNGATVNLVVKYDTDDLEKFQRLIEAFDAEHKGRTNAYKTLHINSAMDVNPVGTNFQQMDFKIVQGAGETRIAADSGIHPVILGLSEGMQGSSLNAGNFNAAKRLTADKTLRWLWQNLCGSMETIIPVPDGARLWYDEDHIPFLAEDVKDAAEIQQLHAQAIRTLVDGGYKPESVIDAVTAGDFSRLEHTGLFSVQLQPPMPEGPPEPANGTVTPAEAGRSLAEWKPLIEGPTR